MNKKSQGMEMLVVLAILICVILFLRSLVPKSNFADCLSSCERLHYQEHQELTNCSRFVSDNPWDILTSKNAEREDYECNETDTVSLGRYCHGLCT